MLTPQSQVLLRNADLFSAGDSPSHALENTPSDSAGIAQTTGGWIIVNAPERAIYRAFPAPYCAWQQMCNHHAPDRANECFAPYLDAADVAQMIPHMTDSEQPAALVGAIVYMPKNKAQLHCILHNLASLLSPGQRVCLVGHNKEGIKSANKVMAPFCDTVNKVDTAKHCALWVGTVKAGVKAFVSTYYQSITDYQHGDLTWPVAGYPGIFSQHKMDAGTAFLLSHLPDTIRAILIYT